MKKENIKQEPTYAFYSKVLKEAFDTVEELAEAEEAYYAKVKAKEDKAAEKKADALKVEEAFKALNAARKVYKEDTATLTKEYAESLEELRTTFEFGKNDIKSKLAAAEDAYAKALKEFTDKYDQYHLTLKDGDFETTLSKDTASTKVFRKDTEGNGDLFKDIFNLFDAFSIF